MDAPLVLQGRRIAAADLDQIRALQAARPVPPRAWDQPPLTGALHTIGPLTVTEERRRGRARCRDGRRESSVHRARSARPAARVPALWLGRLALSCARHLSGPIASRLSGRDLP